MRIAMALVLAAALSVAGSSAAPPPAVVAAVGLTFVPGGRDVPVTLRLDRGGSLELVNLDPLGWHVISSIDLDAEGKPLFGSDSVGMGMTGPVRGVETLPPGDYPFVCWIHTGMEGTLRVVAS